MLLIFIINDSLTSSRLKSSCKLESNHEAKELQPFSEEEVK